MQDYNYQARIQYQRSTMFNRLSYILLLSVIGGAIHAQDTSQQSEATDVAAALDIMEPINVTRLEDLESKFSLIPKLDNTRYGSESDLSPTKAYHAYRNRDLSEEDKIIQKYIKNCDEQEKAYQFCNQPQEKQHQLLASAIAAGTDTGFNLVLERLSHKPSQFIGFEDKAANTPLGVAVYSISARHHDDDKPRKNKRHTIIKEILQHPNMYQLPDTAVNNALHHMKNSDVFFSEIEAQDIEETIANNKLHS